ncbi:MAG TPA: hypothetical protein PLV13_01675, partial [Ilumatobacteraceae bacterium]|nr:hypothetical protein [Ilumatobacteraceae bacterium]
HTAQAADDEPLEFKGTFTYTADVIRGVIHVDAAIDVKDLNKNRPGYCWDGFYIPIPSSATNIVNLASYGLNANGQIVGERPQKTEVSAYEGTTTYSRLLVVLKICISGGRSVRNHLTFDIPGGDPRSDNPVRINPSYVGFDAIGMGRPSKVTTKVVLPSAYEMDHLDDQWTSSSESGFTTYSLAPFTDDNYPDTYIGARNDSALVKIPVDTDTGQSFSIMHWPNDAEWGEFVAGEVERGVPALSEAVGMDWPIDGETQVREAYSNYFDGYAGWFDPDSNEMEIGDDLDQDVVLHELSHAWFNDNWFRERWLSEGFAEAYAAIVMKDLGGDPTAPERLSTSDPGALALESWDDPFYETDGTDDTEQYGYMASYYVISQLVDEIGLDKMREVLRMVDSGETIYPGNGDPEEWNTQSGWKDMLDLLEVVGGSTEARDLLVRYVIEDGDTDQLDRRDDAREVYATLDERSGDWASPVVVRKRLDDWSFSDFDKLVDKTNAVLDVRDQMTELCTDLGIDLPAEVETAYEDATSGGDLDDAKALADDYLEALRHLVDASDAKNGSHGIFGAIGLIASDLDSEFDSARDAFNEGDLPATIEHADKAVSIADDATGQGLLRIGLLVLLILLIAGLVWFLRRRKARKQLAAQQAAEAAEAAAEAAVLTAATGTEAEVSDDPSPPEEQPTTWQPPAVDGNPDNDS